MSKHTKAEPMICDDCFHNTVCRLDGNEMLEWCSARVPSVDVVEVVRCKDCKHFVETGGTRGICCLFQGMTNPRNDDFCSEGERKETE